MTTSAAREIPLTGLGYQPLSHHPDVGEVAQITGTDDATALSTGMVRMTDAGIQRTIRYDEAILMLKDKPEIDTTGETLIADAMQVVWLPAGTELVYRAKKALTFHAIHPANQAEAA
ncbi:MAG: hypothetical protein AB8B85_14560 [Paracoccaceae bacterium]